jgi:hypothetical protein
LPRRFGSNAYRGNSEADQPLLALLKEYDGNVSLSRRFNAAFRRQTRWRTMKKAMRDKNVSRLSNAHRNSFSDRHVDPLSIDEPLRV